MKPAEVETTTVKVKLDNNLDGFIDKENLSMDESEQNPRRYAANENLDAMIKKVDVENNIRLENAILNKAKKIRLSQS